MKGDPLEGFGEKELAEKLAMTLKEALTSGVSVQGALEAISAVVGALIGDAYSRKHHRAAHDAFRLNTWAAIRGRQIFKDLGGADEVGH